MFASHFMNLGKAVRFIVPFPSLLNDRNISQRESHETNKESLDSTDAPSGLLLCY
jgi:hypothetical protein